MAVRENDFDPTTWSDEELEKVARSLGHTGGRSMPQEWQRNKVTSELKRRANARRDKKPSGKPKSNVDQNLEAAATPIAVEPEAGREPGWSVRGRSMRQEQIDRLVEAGDDPETAARVVDSQAEIHGGQIQPGLFDSYDNAALRQRIAEGRQDDARMGAFEADYNAATGNPEYGYDEAGNPARLGRVDINNPSESELVARGARRYQARAPYNAEIEAANYGPGSDYAPSDARPTYADMTVPGPRTLDGKSPTPSRGLTAEEAEAYNMRPAGGLSQRDRDMMARGYVPVVTADGVSYRPGYVSESNKYAIPGGPGRPGPRRDLEVPVAGTQRPKYEMDTATGPDGVPRAVYAPTQEFRNQQNAVLAERRQRLAEERRAALKRWQATASLAGGSQNLNSGNRWVANALAGMTPDEREQAMRYMLPGGALQAQVDTQNAARSAEMAQRAMTAFLANNPGADAESRKRAEDLLMREKNPAMAGARDIADGKHASTEAGVEFDRLADAHDTTMLGFSYENEAALASTLQKPPYNMRQPEAEAKAYELAERRRFISGGGPGGTRPAPPVGLEDVYPAGAM